MEEILGASLRIQQRTVAQIADLPPRCLWNAFRNTQWSRLSTCRLMPLERFQQRTVEQIAVITVPRIFSEFLDEQFGALERA